MMNVFSKKQRRHTQVVGYIILYSTKCVICNKRISDVLFLLSVCLVQA